MLRLIHTRNDFQEPVSALLTMHRELFGCNPDFTSDTQQFGGTAETTVRVTLEDGQTFTETKVHSKVAKKLVCELACEYIEDNYYF